MKVPIRTCVACRKRGEKGRLLRIAKVERGAAFPAAKEVALCWDAEQKLPGRSAYVHPELACLRTILVAGKWERALHLPPGMVDENSLKQVYDRLVNTFAAEAPLTPQGTVAQKKGLRL